MTATFDRFGVRFDYPENWTVEQTDEGPGAQMVSVNSPETAFLQATIRAADEDLEPLFDEALSVLRKEYEEIEVEPANDQIDGVEIMGFSVHFFWLGLMNTCWLGGIKRPEATYLIMCQAEDREYDRVNLVFQAMLVSMFRNFPDQPELSTRF